MLHFFAELWLSNFRPEAADWRGRCRLAQLRLFFLSVGCCESFSPCAVVFCSFVAQLHQRQRWWGAGAQLVNFCYPFAHFTTRSWNRSQPWRCGYFHNQKVERFQRQSAAEQAPPPNCVQVLMWPVLPSRSWMSKTLYSGVEMCVHTNQTNMHTVFSWGL